MINEQIADLRAQVKRAIAACGVIARLYSGDRSLSRLAAPFNEILPEQVKNAGGIKDISIISGLRTVVAGVWMSDYASNVYICYTGVNLSTARQLLYGWQSYRTMVAADGFNSNSFLDAEGAESARGATVLTSDTKIHLYGHSGGGALVEALAHELSKTVPRQLKELTTFGAPKPALRGFTYSPIGMVRTRWMNEGDVVPGLPIGGNVYGASIALDLPGIDYKPWLIQHGTGGRRLSPSGTWTAADDTIGTVPPSIIDVAAWLAGQDGRQGFPHSIDTYARRLTRLEDFLKNATVPEQPPPPPVWLAMPFDLPANRPGGGQPTGPVGTITITGSTASTSSGDTYPVSTTGGFGMASQAFIEKRLRLVYQRAGQVYIVRWNDVVLFQTATASAARTICSSWNRSLRLLGKTTNISMANVNAYLQMIFAAGAAGDGVKPPWNVQ